MSRSPVAIYLHTPFCPSKCGYCDFNSYAMTGEIMERTVRAIEREIAESPWRGRPAKTIFFGGGTPTYLSADQITRLLRAVLEAHPPEGEIEITSEGNPGTVDWPKFDAMRRAGFNRLSLGAQSFAQNDLIRLGRVHHVSDIARAVGEARRAGFDNLNLDLMFALPGQATTAWEHNLETALSLEPEHLSLYCLTIEPNTRYYRYHLRGFLDLPDDERQAQMYERAVEMCAERGLQQYEISNFALPGRECQHNLCYWRAEEYVAYGPGAVGAVAEDGVRQRWTGLKHPDRFCEAIENGVDHRIERETLDAETHRTEQIMLGLRLNAGLDMTGLNLDEAELKRMESRRWVERRENTLVLTPEGRLFHTEVAAALI